MLSPGRFLPTSQWSVTPFDREHNRYTATLQNLQPSSICPDCGTTSSRIHSRYTRMPADLPMAGVPVTLAVEARRFFCEARECPRQTFSEPFPGFLARSRRRTERLERLVEALGLALGGEAGARLAQPLAIRVSADTVLRTLRRLVLPAVPEPRVLGVDDWAFRRGHTYGTILVDLERHCPIDLLPDRKAETLAAWLKQHPRITLISRDRAGAYAEGARQGAPQAQQIADRWHLLKNLRETVERLLSRHYRVLQETASAVPPPAPGPTAIAPPKRLTRAEQVRAEHRARRLARYEAAVDLRQQGWSIRAIAHHLDLERATVRRFLEADGFPERAVRAPVPSFIDRFRPYLQQRWQDGIHNARQLFQEIAQQGFPGSESLVRRALQGWRVRSVASDKAPNPAVVQPVPHVSPRQASFWLLDIAKSEDPEDSRKQRAFVTRLCEQVPAIATARTLATTFIRLIRQRRAADVPGWLIQAEQSGLSEFRGFARSLRQDEEAVLAAFRRPWSQGQVEGQVNRLKVLKRSMYGRASLELLRLRVLSGCG